MQLEESQFILFGLQQSVEELAKSLYKVGEVSKILTNKEFSRSHVKRFVMVSDRDGFLLLYFDY